MIEAPVDVIFLENPDSLWSQLIDSLEPAGIQVNNQQKLPLFSQLVRRQTVVGAFD